jgi:hypothetical protein
VVFTGVFIRLLPTPDLGFDYRIFRQAGGDVWAGQDPYAVERFASLPLLNPPTALPLFALFALVPFKSSFLIWTAVNVLACLALLPISQGVLLAQERWAGEETPGQLFCPLPSLVLAGLTPALFLSGASLDTVWLGQMSIFEAVVLLAALGCQAAGRPIFAAFWLALASIKTATMLPFLLLFHRKADLRTWVALPVIVLGLCLATGRPSDLPGRLTSLLERIKELESPGRVNDYSFEGTRSENMLGFDHAFYRLGMRDRQMIRLAQYLALALLGGWVGWLVVSQRLPRGAACSLIALFSVVFLYHRTYDTVILALPFVYCAGQARTVGGGQRTLFVGCAVAILLVWNLDATTFHTLQQHSLDWGPWGRLVQAVVLPYPTWLTLAAMIGLVAASHRRAVPLPQ